MGDALGTPCRPIFFSCGGLQKSKPGFQLILFSFFSHSILIFLLALSHGHRAALCAAGQDASSWLPQGAARYYWGAGVAVVVVAAAVALAMRQRPPRASQAMR